jgi:hypothetical protein
MSQPARNGAIASYGDNEAFLREVAASYGWETAAAIRASIADARARDDGTIEEQIARIQARKREIRERMDELVDEYPELKSRGSRPLDSE